MSKFESNVQYIKYLVNRECASRFFNGELDKEINMEKEIAEAIIPGPKASFRCCIYKERHIIDVRLTVSWSAIPAAAVWGINVRRIVRGTPFPL